MGKKYKIILLCWFLQNAEESYSISIKVGLFKVKMQQ